MVTATRTTRRAADVSRAVNVLGPEVLAERLPRNSAEALREEVGISVQKTEHGGGNAIIRGLGSNQVLLLVDGVRLNNSTYRFGNHPYLATVDNHMLQRLEVVRGPGSVLFGSDAMGGAVNLVTRQATVGGESLAARGRASARFGSADEEKILRAEGGHAWLERSPETQPHSGYEGMDYGAKLATRLAPGHDVALVWQGTRRPEVPRYDKYENEKFFRWLYTDQERDLGYLTYKCGSGSVPVRVFLSRQRQEEGCEFRRTATSSETREWGEVATWGMGTQAGYSFRNHSLTAGVDAYLDRVDSRRDVVDVGTGEVTPQSLVLYPDGSYYGSYGAFLQDEFRLAKDVTATVGARYSLCRVDFSVPYDPKLALDFNRVEEDFRALTGSAGIGWCFAPGLWLIANAAQGFHAPNLSDLSKTGESKGATYEIPNPDLEPEKILSLDVGLKLVEGHEPAAPGRRRGEYRRSQLPRARLGHQRPGP